MLKHKPASNTCYPAAIGTANLWYGGKKACCTRLLFVPDQLLQRFVIIF